MKKKREHGYYCRHCKRIIMRPKLQLIYKSYCERAGKTSYMLLVKP